MRLLRWVGPLLLAGLICYAGPRELWAALRHAHLGWLALAWALNVPQLGLKAFRWFLTVRWQAIPLSYPRALLAYFGSLLVGFLTPGRVGEMAKVFTLKHECGVPVARGLSSVIFDRVFDLFLLLVLGSVGFLRYSVAGRLLSWPALAGVALCFVLPLAFLSPAVVRRLAAAAAMLPVLHAKRVKILEKAEQFAGGLAVFTPARLVLCALLTLASYSIFFLQCVLCARALGFAVPFFDMVFLMAATNLITFIPVSISGLGTRDAALIYFLGRTLPPQPEPVALAFSMTIFLVFFVGGGLIGWLCWQWAPIGLREDMRAIKTRGLAPEEQSKACAVKE